MKLSILVLAFLVAALAGWDVSEARTVSTSGNNKKTSSATEIEFKYYDYVEMTRLLKRLAKEYPRQTHLYSIGKTVEEREMWVMAIAHDRADEHVKMRPEVKYVGNMHGNEVPSKQVLIYLIQYLLQSHRNESSSSSSSSTDGVEKLLRQSRIHIMPSMNPDGFEKSSVGDCISLKGRGNANGFDLNRNFPDLFECNQTPVQPETAALIRWLEKNSFVLSANLHGGSVVANYPFDNYKGAGFFSKPVASVSDDNDVFKHMALKYSLNHRTMSNTTCKGFGSQHFDSGITNGGAWYPLQGGMQDYNYWRFGCMEITLEISCCKYPPADELESLWLDNKPALIEYLKLAQTGVRGLVTYSDGKPAKHVGIQIDSREPIFKTNELGEYYRILLPGTYKLSVLTACKHVVHEQEIEITEAKPLLRLDIELVKNSRLIHKRSKKLDRFAFFCSKDKQPVHCAKSGQAEDE